MLHYTYMHSTSHHGDHTTPMPSSFPTVPVPCGWRVNRATQNMAILPATRARGVYTNAFVEMDGPTHRLKLVGMMFCINVYAPGRINSTADAREQGQLCLRVTYIRIRFQRTPLVVPGPVGVYFFGVLYGFV